MSRIVDGTIGVVFVIISLWILSYVYTALLAGSPLFTNPSCPAPLYAHTCLTPAYALVAGITFLGFGLAVLKNVIKPWKRKEDPDDLQPERLPIIK